MVSWCPPTAMSASNHGIKLSFLGSAQRVKGRTGVIGEMLVQKPGRSLAVAVPRRNKMKNNLRMLGLALCMLPMCLHTGTGQDLKPTYQPAQRQNTRSAEPIPAGTLIPISLNSALRSDKTGSG